jgi:hypothetical protein
MCGGTAQIKGFIRLFLDGATTSVYGSYPKTIWLSLNRVGFFWLG